MINIKIPATSANLGAGFDALGLALNYYNYVEMEESDVIDIASSDDIPVPCDERNLIYLSAKDLYAVCGRKLEGLKLRQTNNIPMARGLGSSSACIIAGLVGANRMLGDPLTKDDLVDLAAQIEGHPDNTAPALLGGIVTAVFDGRKVHWVKQEVYTKLKFVAMIPDFELKTEEARACLPKEVSHKDAVYNLSRAALFSASLLTGKFENLRTAVHDKLHQPYRMELIPGCREVFDIAYTHGAYASYISGAGPTVMSIVDVENTYFAGKMKFSLDNAGLGGWQVNTSYSELLAETDRAVFDKALEGLTGAAYTPIQVIAKQTVSGTNYAFLCLETMVTGVPNANHAILTVYENTEGAVEILNIKALDLTDLPVIAESKDEDLLGGWEVTGSGKPGALTAESEQALSDALAGVSGVTYMPIVLLGTQVVSGMNYKFLCYGTASENNPATNLYVVTVYQDASGKSELSSSELFDLNACVTVEN